MRKLSIKRVISRLGLERLLSIVFYMFRVFKVDSNKIVCTNFKGKGYGDNPKYIVEELIKRRPEIDIVWAVNKKDTSIPTNIRQIKIGSIKWFFELSTAKVWINNTRFQKYVRKRKSQFYIQTWHGGSIPLKMVEKDAQDILDISYINAAKNDSKMIDIMISNSKDLESLYKKSFWYDGEVMNIGCPRNDLLFDKKHFEEITSKVKNKFNIPENKKIIMYAPTFRDNYDFNYFSIGYEKIIRGLREYDSNEYVYAIRLHPNIAKKYKIDDENIYNFSLYPDGYELLVATDILISDYSSTFVDFMCLKRPIYLYVPDYDKYMSGRGIYSYYNELPFPINYSNENLEESIISNEYEENLEKINAFYKRKEFADDGHASERVCNLIEKYM